MRSCVTAQLPQLFSMRRPGVKFMDSESVEEPTAEKLTSMVLPLVVVTFFSTVP